RYGEEESPGVVRDRIHRLQGPKLPCQPGGINTERLGDDLSRLRNRLVVVQVHRTRNPRVTEEEGLVVLYIGDLLHLLQDIREVAVVRGGGPLGEPGE